MPGLPFAPWMWMVLLKQPKVLVLFELNATLRCAGGARGAARRWTGTDTTSCATGAARWLWQCVGAMLIAQRGVLLCTCGHLHQHSHAFWRAVGILMLLYVIVCPEWCVPCRTLYLHVGLGTGW